GAAATLKRVSLELGGNAPSLVFADADVDRAAAAVAASSHRNAGQTCICTNRAIVHESVHDRFVEALVRHVQKYRLGSGLDPACNHGPLISAAAVQRVADKVADAASKGAEVVYGGSRPAFAEGDALGKGSFYAPTVLAGATPEMRCFKEEIFGPVTPVFAFRHEEEAIKMANSTEYGLAAYLYTQDLERAWWATERLEYGMVGVNEAAITSEVAPFGGVKHSGQGREQSKYGLDEYLQLKTVCMAQRHRG
ncbi:aldehyde dehydrogenase, partial [Helicosporidium sp. ATCC 50920]